MPQSVLVHCSQDECVTSLLHVQIMITVLDENDRTPLLQLPSLSFTVSENTSDPVYITTAIATDDDIGKRLNSLIEIQ